MVVEHLIDGARLVALLIEVFGGLAIATALGVIVAFVVGDTLPVLGRRTGMLLTSLGWFFIAGVVKSYADTFGGPVGSTAFSIHAHLGLVYVWFFLGGILAPCICVLLTADVGECDAAESDASAA